MDVVPRSGWEARPPARPYRNIPTPTDNLWLHHTGGNEAGPEGMQAIQDFHIDSRGWADIGYSFVYDPASRTWFEGRGAGVAGAHTSGHNRTSHGLCVMGNFQFAAATDEIVADVAGMVAHGHAAGWWSDRLTGGHRDVGSTACPGKHLYRRIDDINEGVGMGLSDREVEVVRELVAALDEVGSNGWALKVLVEHVRNHPSGGGLSESDVRRLIAGTELRP